MKKILAFLLGFWPKCIDKTLLFNLGMLLDRKCSYKYPQKSQIANSTTWKNFGSAQ